MSTEFWYTVDMKRSSAQSISLDVDREDAHKTMGKAAKLQSEVNSLYQKLTKSDPGEIYIACNSLNRVIGHCSNMAEDTIGMSLV